VNIFLQDLCQLKTELVQIRLRNSAVYKALINKARIGPEGKQAGQWGFSIPEYKVVYGKNISTYGKNISTYGNIIFHFSLEKMGGH